MKTFNLKAFLITLLLFTSIVVSLNTVTYSNAATSTSQINAEVVKPEPIDSTNIYFHQAKELEAAEIINSKHFAPKLNKEEITELLICIDSLCLEYDVEYEYVKGIIANESRWNHTVKGYSADYGLMQITPIAAREVNMTHGDSLFIPSYNVEAGIKLLAVLKKSFTSMNSVLVAYNAGSGNVRKYGNAWVQKHKYLKGVNKWMNYYKSV